MVRIQHSHHRNPHSISASLPAVAHSCLSKFTLWSGLPHTRPGDSLLRWNIDWVITPEEGLLKQKQISQIMIVDQNFYFMCFRERIRKERILVQGTILEYQTQVHARNAQWNQTNQNFGVWSGVMYIAGPCKESRWLMLRKPWTLQTPKGFSKAFLKGRWGSGESQGVWLAHALFSDWLMVRYQFFGAVSSS